jgi:eukaryotic-like serine/threonine-protein kinase
MPLSVGDKLGPYEILAPIGAGGMGEVYRARDTKLEREVAIKVLPAALAKDAERLARFEREAKVLASLNHPNIAQIYGIEESNGVRALVMELVPGQTLKGALPLETALNYAKQIADALEAAHDKGITHRDLKPANIMVTPAGVIKVLDFGLAAVSQASTPGDGNPTNSPTLTMHATQAGMIMGTAAYMSPEQASGKPADKRADIWSFGVVLWEMLTGMRLFDGETVSHVLAAVLTKEPDLAVLPARIRYAVDRCLRKDSRKRWQAIGDVRMALEELPATAVADARSVRPLPWMIAAGVLGLTALALGFVHFREKPPALAIPTRFQIPSPTNAPFGPQMSLSPDGRLLAFTAGSDGTIWIRPLDALEARPLAGTRNSNGQPFFWSPDSRFIAYGASGKLMKVEVSGGPPQALCDAPQGVIGGSWNREGVILFGQASGGLMRVPAAGGVASPVTALDPSRLQDSMPQFLPDGRNFVYLRYAAAGSEGNAIYVGSLDRKTRDAKLVVSSFGAAYAQAPDSAAGNLLFMRGQILMAQPFDLERLELAGEAVTIADGIGAFLSHGYFSVSPNGVLVYRKGGSNANFRLAWFDHTGKEIGFVSEPGAYVALALSPDGTRVAVGKNGAVNQDIWVIDVARNTNTRFTSGATTSTAPVWSPDGSSIVYLSAINATGGGIRRKFLGGPGAEEQLVADRFLSVIPWDWSRDGRYLLYGKREQNGKAALWFLPMDPAAKDRKPEPFLANEFNNSQAQFSPDSHWVAYASDESGKTEIYVQPFPSSSNGAGKTKVSEGGGTYPRWRRDGKELFYISGDQHLMAVEVTTTPAFKAGIPKALFPTLVFGTGGVGPFRWDVSADGKRFLIDTAVTETAEEPITVVTNWQAGLKK